MADSKAQCECCIFWREGYSQYFSKIGTCRRHAPRPVHDPEDRGDPACWPVTHPTDWCGDFHFNGRAGQISGE
jgi:hypothetical protein